MARDVNDAEILIRLQRIERWLQALTYQLELHGLGEKALPAQVPTRELPDDGN